MDKLADQDKRLADVLSVATATLEQTEVVQGLLQSSDASHRLDLTSLLQESSRLRDEVSRSATKAQVADLASAVQSLSVMSDATATSRQLAADLQMETMRDEQHPNLARTEQLEGAVDARLQVIEATMHQLVCLAESTALVTGTKTLLKASNERHSAQSDVVYLLK